MDAAFFTIPKALIKGGGRRSVGPPISKFCKDLFRALRGRLVFIIIHTSESAHPNNDLLEPAAPRTYPSQYGNVDWTGTFGLLLSISK